MIERASATVETFTDLEENVNKIHTVWERRFQWKLIAFSRFNLFSRAQKWKRPHDSFRERINSHKLPFSFGSVFTFQGDSHRLFLRVHPVFQHLFSMPRNNYIKNKAEHIVIRAVFLKVSKTIRGYFGFTLQRSVSDFTDQLEENPKPVMFLQLVFPCYRMICNFLWVLISSLSEGKSTLQVKMLIRIIMMTMLIMMTITMVMMMMTTIRFNACKNWARLQRLAIFWHDHNTVKCYPC